VSEEAAIYRADLSETGARLAMVEADLDRWKNRVRTLEDAILLHKQRLYGDEKPSQHDLTLWAEVDSLWT